MTETRTQMPDYADRRISNPLQYHYGTIPFVKTMVDRVGIEPTDICLQSRQEPQLNHSPYKNYLGGQGSTRSSTFLLMREALLPLKIPDQNLVPGVRLELTSFSV